MKRIDGDPCHIPFDEGLGVPTQVVSQLVPGPSGPRPQGLRQSKC